MTVSKQVSVSEVDCLIKTISSKYESQAIVLPSLEYGGRAWS